MLQNYVLHNNIIRAMFVQIFQNHCSKTVGKVCNTKLLQFDTCLEMYRSTGLIFL